MVVLALAPVLLVSCAQTVAPTKPDKPVYEEERVIAILQEHLEGHYAGYWWATPIFPIHKWSASYAGDKIWLVKAYNIDESYMGTWSVKELSLSELEEGLGNKIEPYDEAAKAPKYIMTPLPESLSFRFSYSRGFFSRNRETLIRAIQEHIANMSYQEAKDKMLEQTWEAIRVYYPIDWRISYTDTTWILTGIDCEAYVDAYTGQIDVHYASTIPSW